MAQVDLKASSLLPSWLIAACPSVFLRVSKAEDYAASRALRPSHEKG